MELSLEQIMLIGFIASVASQLLKLLADKFGFKPGKKVMTFIVFVVAVVLAFAWGDFSVPAGSDPMDFAVVLLEQAFAVFGFAVGIYKLLLKEIVYPAVNLG